MEGSFTLTFEPPYYVGIFERYNECGYSAAKIIFGAEPSDEQVRMALLYEFRNLQFSLPVPERPEFTYEMSYKRRQRELKRMMEQEPGISEEVRAALQEERKRQKEERERQARLEREAEEERKYLLRKERQKEKKRGH